MTDFDAVARALVDAARVGMSPGPEQRARVLERTLSSVSRGTVTTESEPVLRAEAVPFRFAARRLLTLGVLMGAAGIAGYALGRRDGRAEEVASAPPSATVASAPAPVERALPSATPAPQPSAEPSDSSARTAEAAGVRRAQRGAASAPSKRPPELDSAQALLDEELRTLRRVERALRDGNPRFALGLLGELDREVPNGKLREERRAARVIATCQLAPADAEARLAEFSRAHPNSVYLDRVRQSCAASDAQKP